MTSRWKAVEHYFTVMLFVFQLYTVCNFAKLIKFGLGTVNPLSPGVKLQILLLCFHTFLTEVVGRSC